MRKSCYWMVLSLGAAYLLTVFVNGLRIIFSVYILFYMSPSALGSGLVTPERVHLAIGVILYFTSLFAIYRLGEYAARKIACASDGNLCRCPPGYADQSFRQMVYQFMPPICCYFSITLGVPFLNGAYKNDHEKFMAYAVSVTVLCVMLGGLFYLVSVLRKRFGSYYSDR